uniref:Uncharacterized protein n=1 Tax=Pyxicephalus adspersus TaxID=30357 RepID=A0AAV3A4I4_PYXAD|nr:TPA: hypothetical protein GDO54_017999 [Pyxicephalus adspersus]
MELSQFCLMPFLLCVMPPLGLFAVCQVVSTTSKGAPEAMISQISQQVIDLTYFHCS